MPDRNTPNWTPDETFWDEGWADMDRQLSKKRRRPYLLFFLLLLGCIGLAGALVLYSPEDSLAAEAIAPESVELQPIASSDQVDSQISPAETENSHSDGFRSPAKTATSRKGGSARTAAPKNRRSALGIPPAPALRAPLDEAGEREQKSSTGSPLVAVGQLETSLLLLPGRDPLLKFPPAPPIADSTAEIAAFAATPGSSAWAVSLGANAYISSLLPGGFAGGEYRRNWGKWFVPVSLRYDYGRRQLKLADDFVVENTFPAGNTGGSVAGFNSSTFRSQVESSSLNRVETHTLELRTGAGHRISDRFSLSGGAGIAYLLSGSGPAITGYADSTYYGLSVQQDPLFYNPSTADLAGAGSGRPANTSVYRWGVNGWLNIDYRIGQKWTAGLGITRHLTPLYRDDVLDSERTRFEIRVTKAW